MNYLSALQKLEINGGGAVTTTELPWTVHYRVKSSTAAATPPAEATGTTSGASTVQLVPAPSAGTVYELVSLSLFNADTAVFVATLRFNDNTTIRKTEVFTLAVGDNLFFSNGHFYILDTNGNKR